MTSVAPFSAPRRILATGANRGLGLATALELARKGHKLILTARRLEDVDPLKRRILAHIPHAVAEVRPLDLASFGSIRRFAVSVVSCKAPIHVVLHNAGLVLPPPQRRLTVDGIEESLAVAAVGPLLLSLNLLPVLAQPSRLVGVNSALHAPHTYGDEVSFRFDDPHMESGYTATRAYKNAKLAQLWFLFEWERRFGSQGLHADAVSPGFVPSTAAPRAKGLQRLLLRYVFPLLPFARTVDDAVRAIVRACEDDLSADGGRYFESEALAAASADARSTELASEFWALAEGWLQRQPSSD